ncbi:MAG: hypothetical protein ACI4SI_02540, partial [Candidatus Ornithospirochaeta sp.]
RKDLKYSCQALCLAAFFSIRIMIIIFMRHKSRLLESVHVMDDQKTETHGRKALQKRGGGSRYLSLFQWLEYNS